MFCITRKTNPDWVPQGIIYGALDRTAPAYRFGEHCFLIRLKEGLQLDEDLYDLVEAGHDWIPKNRIGWKALNDWVCFRTDQIVSIEYLGAFPHDIYVEDHI